jgi:mercuric ion transport protein
MHDPAALRRETAMTDRKLLGVGLGGSALAALCCFTPALVLLLGALGLSAWLAWLDYVLLPALGLFLGIAAYALLRRRKA